MHGVNSGRLSPHYSVWVREWEVGMEQKTI